MLQYYCRRKHRRLSAMRQGCQGLRRTVSLSQKALLPHHLWVWVDGRNCHGYERLRRAPFYVSDNPMQMRFGLRHNFGVRGRKLTRKMA